MGQKASCLVAKQAVEFPQVWLVSLVQRAERADSLGMAGGLG